MGHDPYIFIFGESGADRTSDFRNINPVAFGSEQDFDVHGVSSSSSRLKLMPSDFSEAMLSKSSSAGFLSVEELSFVLGPESIRSLDRGLIVSIVKGMGSYSKCGEDP